MLSSTNIPVSSMSEAEVTLAIQKKELEMLVDLKQFMENNHIPFYLACGTALGCVRHHGFIPWDDDVDIYIWGKDYPALQSAFKNHINTNLELHDCTTHEGYPYPFPKIVATNTELKEKDVDYKGYKCGIYIDVFLLSDLSNNRLIRKLEEMKRYFYYCLIRAYYHNYSGPRSVINKLARRLVNPSRAQIKHIKCCMRERKKSRFTMDTGVFGRQGYIKRKALEESVDLDFCGYLLPMPGDYETYLTDYYGQYMELPPREEQHPIHFFEALIIDGERVV